jgi:hypothetical protein
MKPFFNPFNYIYDTSFLTPLASRRRHGGERGCDEDFNKCY